MGKADYKNPKGQMPNALLDGNRGYECDNNQGIGKTNPAHTGCKPADTNQPPVVKPPVVKPPLVGKPPVVDTPPVVPPVEEKPSVPDDEVLPLPPIQRDVLRPAPEPVPVVQPQPVSPLQAPLPFTGSEAWLFFLVGSGLIGTGWMALLSLPMRARRLRL